MLRVRPKQREGDARQQVFEVPDRQSKSNSRYCLHKLSKHKNRNVTRSLHSIEVNTNSLQLRPNSKRTATKHIFLSDRQHPPSDRQYLPSDSSRKATEELSSKAGVLDKIIKLNNRSLVQKLQTIEGDELQQNEKKLMGCIQMMQGVLEQIQNEKESRQMFKSVRYLDPNNPDPNKATYPDPNRVTYIDPNRVTYIDPNKATKHSKPHPHQAKPPCEHTNQSKPSRADINSIAQKQNRSGQKTKFEEYIQNVCQSRENSKVLLIRKAKTKSTLITNEELKASIVTNPKRFQTINNERLQKYQQQPPKRIPNIQIIVERSKTQKGLQEMEVSAIDKVNQSSFISDCGRKELMGDLSGSPQCVLRELQEGKASKRNSQQEAGSASKGLQVNLRKLCKVKNSKKLKSIFPTGFF